MEVLLIGVGVVVAFSIFLMLLFTFIANSYQASVLKRRMDEIDEASLMRRQPYQKPKTNQDFLSRDHKQESKERAKEEAQETELMPYVPLGQDVGKGKSEVNQVKIVGLAKPVGMWTQFIMKQKLGFMLARMSLQSNDKGYWVNLIKAQSMQKGRDQTQGRGRW